jgi:hypothetical protein
MLLHSTSHRSIDYTAKEDRPSGSRPLLKHYIGVFDPKTGKMEIIESKKMVVRGTVRSQKPPDAALRPKVRCIPRVVWGARLTLVDGFRDENRVGRDFRHEEG